MVTKHIKYPKPYPGILFTDFSSAFNSIMTDGSINLKLNTNGHFALWIKYFLSDHPHTESLYKASSLMKKFEHMGAPRLCFISCI